MHPDVSAGSVEHGAFPVIPGVADQRQIVGEKSGFARQAAYPLPESSFVNDLGSDERVNGILDEILDADLHVVLGLCDDLLTIDGVRRVAVQWEVLANGPLHQEVA